MTRAGWQYVVMSKHTVTTALNRIRLALRATRPTPGLATRAERADDNRRIDYWQGIARQEREGLMRALDAAEGR
jgi:hypothetical protein